MPFFNELPTHCILFGCEDCSSSGSKPHIIARRTTITMKSFLFTLSVHILVHGCRLIFPVVTCGHCICLYRKLVCGFEEWQWFRVF